MMLPPLCKFSKKYGFNIMKHLFNENATHEQDSAKKEKYYSNISIETIIKACQNCPASEVWLLGNMALKYVMKSFFDKLAVQFDLVAFNLSSLLLYDDLLPHLTSRWEDLVS